MKNKTLLLKCSLIDSLSDSNKYYCTTLYNITEYQIGMMTATELKPGNKDKLKTWEK